MSNNDIYNFRKATSEDVQSVWQIIEQAIQRRKAEGSLQWQSGYPNQEVIAQDIAKGVGYVLCAGNKVIGYTAALVNDEPEYTRLKGEWLTERDFIVFHRVAIHEDYLGKGLAKHMLLCIEDVARQQQINSIKADTNYDNLAMLRIFESLGYAYCGEVTFRGDNVRMAFEKVLTE